MKKFKRNPQTGILEVCENGKKVGEIITMGDIIMSDEKKEKTTEIKKNGQNLIIQIQIIDNSPEVLTDVHTAMRKPTLR